jgi:hypothetical protein
MAVMMLSCGNDVAPAPVMNEQDTEAVIPIEGAGINEPDMEAVTDMNAKDSDPYTQARNLQKLCRVWGFTKYTHQAFLTGERCWDEELLNLIPVITDAGEGDVNVILYDWFTGLGDDGYELDWPLIRSGWLDITARALEAHLEYDESHELYTFITEMYIDLFGFGLEDYIALLSGFNEKIFNTETSDWLSFHALFDEMLWFNTGLTEINRRPMAETGWISDASYLGEPLSAALSRFQGIQAADLSNAPVSFDQLGNSVFPNEKNYYNMDYGDPAYRLLGLFRLWNAMEYYFPYLDIIDGCWHEILLDFIPRMLEGSDRLSYHQTLAALSSKLRDAHIWFEDMPFFGDTFGIYSVNVVLHEAEGRLVVPAGTPHRVLMAGDVILRLDGKDINDVAEEMLPFLSYPNDGRALSYISFYSDILRSRNSIINIDVLRDGGEVSLEIRGSYRLGAFRYTHPRPASSHQLLENNIGLINPSRLVRGSIQRIMAEFADTDGLIIDLRQYPSWFMPFELGEYLIEENQLFAIISRASQFLPGVYMDLTYMYSGGIQSPEAYYYDKPVVILMDERTMSQPEYTIMSLRNGANVTVMGDNSIGADGNVTVLPLPGGITMWYTGLGIYTPEGGQTQRIGLSPDIYVFRTVEGIREGRDELMEAAIEYILGK